MPADLQSIGGWIGTVVTLPLYGVVWKAAGTFRDIQADIKSTATAVIDLKDALSGHNDRLTELELERARQEGIHEARTEQQLPWDGRDRRKR